MQPICTQSLSDKLSSQIHQFAEFTQILHSNRCAVNDIEMG